MSALSVVDNVLGVKVYFQLWSRTLETFLYDFHLTFILMINNDNVFSYHSNYISYYLPCNFFFYSSFILLVVFSVCT